MFYHSRTHIHITYYADSTYSRSTYLITYLLTYIATHITVPYLVFLNNHVCAWSVTFDARDQRKPGDTRDQSHIDTPEQSCSSFTLDQSFLLRVISVVSATRVISYFHLLLISHDAWSVTHLCAWSALTPDQRKLHQITPDQSTSSTPDQTQLLISVKYHHDAWSITYLYAWSDMTPDQRKLHHITPDQSISSTPDQTWLLISVKYH